MPPFVYQAPENRSANSIAGLLLRPGEIEAQRATAVANAQGQAAQQIGNSIAGTAQQLTDPRRKMDAMAVQHAQELQAGEQRLDQIAKPYTPNGPQPEGAGAAPTQHPYLDDQGLYDIPKLTQALAANGMTHLAPDLLKGAESINESILKHQEYAQKAAQQQTILFGDMADGVVKMTKAGMPFDQALDLAAAPGLATKRFDPQQFGQIKAKLLSLPPEQQQAALGNLMDQAAKLGGGENLSKDAQRLDRYGRVIASNIVEEPGKGDYTINGQRFNAKGQPIGAAVPIQEAPDQAALRGAQLREIDAKLNGTIPLSAKDKAELQLQRDRLALEQQKATDAKGDKTDLTPEGLDAAAMLFAKTGQLPALGMGDKTTRKAIINRAAVMVPGLDVASAKADFEANRKSLDNIAGTLDTLESFSKAAGKNLDQFVSLATKLPDTGVPWANTPLRLLNDKLVGAEWAPAVNAARAVATREVARITGDPKLKGVLSDAARHEVDALVPGDITFNQLKRVIPILKTDMDNVHSSLSEQKTAIQGRIKLGATTSEGVSVTSPGGKSYPFHDQASADRFVADAKAKGLWK